MCFYLGVYKIDVLQSGRPVRGSPYLCQVYDASKVKIEHSGMSNIVVNDPISFKREYFWFSWFELYRAI